MKAANSRFNSRDKMTRPAPTTPKVNVVSILLISQVVDGWFDVFWSLHRSLWKTSGGMSAREFSVLENNEPRK